MSWLETSRTSFVPDDSPESLHRVHLPELLAFNDVMILFADETWFSWFCEVESVTLPLVV
jgi:hypothetical protein